MNITANKLENNMDVLAKLMKNRKNLNKFSEVLNNYGFETIESIEQNVNNLCKISTQICD